MRTAYFALFMVLSFALSAQKPTHTQDIRADEISGFKLYPNPAYGEMVHVITKDNALKDIKVYDVFGEVVLTDKISRKTLNISRLVPGVYVMQVTENEKTITRKLVVK